jgi:thiamine transport system ATP-binding protein
VTRVADEAGVPRVQVEGATVRFGPITALDGVDLSVPAGEVVAVLGPSGSGKSTLLRAIAGLQPLDAGAVRLDGADQRQVPPHRRDVGLMFQDHALFPHADVRGNVAFGLRMRGVRGDVADRRVAGLLDLVGLAGAGRRAITTLSGGEQQRVALARALAPEPRLLMLDEPFGALDRLLRERLVRELRTLFVGLGQTVLAVNHGEAFALADRVVVMGRGKVLQAGAPADVWANPVDVEVARFLGFENLGDAEIRDGSAVTPWGGVPAHGATGRATALVRPAGVVLDGTGPLQATVASVTFRGSRVIVELEIEGAPRLLADVPTTHAPIPGTRVRARIDPGEVVLLR